MRYARQTVLADVGPKGQEAFGKARVLIVGAGGLGSPLALYLAAAGVGTLGLVDADQVGLSNLQRQILFTTHEIGLSKVERAAERLVQLNPEVKILRFAEFLDSSNAESIAADYDIIVDASDNFETKYLLNDLAVKLDKPLVYGSILRFAGQASVFWASHGPCYRCLFPSLPQEAIPNCAEAGVIGALAGVIGSIQALEVLKLILLQAKLLPDHHQTLIGRFLSFDGATMNQTVSKVPRDPDCSVCGGSRESIVLPDLDLSCAVNEKSQREIMENWQDYRFIDVREESEWERGHIPGAILFPLSHLKSGQLPKPLARPTVIYCQSGVRSRQALTLLKEQGWSEVLHLPEGFGAWAGPVEQGM